MCTFCTVYSSHLGNISWLLISPPDLEECVCNETDALLQCMHSRVGWVPFNARSSRGGRVAPSVWSWGLDCNWLSQGLTACNQYKHNIQLDDVELLNKALLLILHGLSCLRHKQHSFGNQRNIIWSLFQLARKWTFKMYDHMIYMICCCCPLILTDCVIYWFFNDDLSWQM